MRRTSVVLALLSIAVMLSACSRGSPDATLPSGIGSDAPAFTLPAANGHPVALSDFTGRNVLLYFSMGPG